MAIFRYPGGKNKLLVDLAPFIDAIIGNGKEFHDVFVGGGSVLVDTAKRYPDICLSANDLDENIYSFWKLVSSSENASEFADKIYQQPTVKLFERLRATEPSGAQDRAYRAVFFNRTTFSGISTSGPIGGYKQKSKWGIDCRYNAKRIIEEFKELRSLLKNRLTVTRRDALEYVGNCKSAMYLDPPYYEKGGELYQEKISKRKHGQLAKVLEHKDKWALSYDDNAAIISFYDWATIFYISARYSIKGEKKKWQKSSELVIVPLNVFYERMQQEMREIAF